MFARFPIGKPVIDDANDLLHTSRYCVLYTYMHIIVRCAITIYIYTTTHSHLHFGESLEGTVYTRGCDCVPAAAKRTIIYLCTLYSRIIRRDGNFVRSSKKESCLLLPTAVRKRGTHAFTLGTTDLGSLMVRRRA